MSTAFTWGKPLKRRGFLGSILAAGFAPAAVASGVLMPLGKVWRPDQRMNATEVWHRQQAMLDDIERAINPPIVMLHTEFLRQLMRLGYAGIGPDGQPLLTGARVIAFEGIDRTPGGYGSGQIRPAALDTRAPAAMKGIAT